MHAWIRDHAEIRLFLCCGLLIFGPFPGGTPHAPPLGTASTYKLSGDLPGVSLANPAQLGECESTSPTELVCSTPFDVDLGPDFDWISLEADLKATGNAVAGSTGKVTATLAAKDVAPVSTSATVEVAESVDLAAGESIEISAKPGSAFDARSTVTNKSTKVVTGAGVFGYTDYAFEVAERFSNCEYRGKVVGCLFTEDLEAGVTYGVDLPFRLRKDTAAPGRSAVQFQWMTAADYAKAADRLAAGSRKAAEGAKLRLVPVSAAKARVAQTDSKPDDNWQEFSVRATGAQGVDLAAVGAKASGAAGSTVTVRVGVRNNGPAALDSGQDRGQESIAIVTVPTGTTVTTIPMGCYLARGNVVKTDPQAEQYVCYGGTVRPVGETVSWEFGLRIDKVVADAKGRIESNPACECSRFDQDIDKSNDKAEIVINPSGAEPGTGGNGGNGGSGDADGNGGTGGESGGEGGGLPITGPQGTAIAGVGVLLVAAGAAGFVIARKRRTRFEV
ncbi:hypothetical protein QLQ12_03785 [Actinoplanes sp. NEAU-A12]|uniref:LPXTG cell wall anchor domain-containing protein n=1 Tax=Actinoplanes sandaracinus TaxID=3045177 RepID=A0ABT6WDC0_9ACTN|nr:hypothetical protein [Actinoplanes sandaracinus]MDI6097721.1 hypothetical protein [Actinoplanes sandaracinus]